MIFDILTLIVSIMILTLVTIIYIQKGKVWIHDDVNKLPMPQKVNRKKLKMEIKKLQHQDVYNSFVIYDDLELVFPENVKMQDIIDRNRKTDKPIEIVWNDYTKSFHIKYKNHYRKIINSSK